MLPSIWRNTGAMSAPTLDDFVEKFFYGWPQFRDDMETSWSPRADVQETDTDYVIDIELSGIDKTDIKVEVKNDVLTISGERKEEKKTKEKGYQSIERHYGQFERKFSLPDIVNAENISAKYDNGVMTLTLPKTEKALPREIAVEVK
ncbi:Hsp20/alpha crystallin family protein [Candidatus Latescibacterota bacterium]